MTDIVGQFIELNTIRVKWTRKQADRASGNLVYIFWGMEDGKEIALYVGRTLLGLARPLSPAHAAARQAHSECERMEFLCHEDPKEIERLEKQLIYHLQPKYNVSGNRQGIRITRIERAKRKKKFQLRGNITSIRKSIERSIAKDTR